MQSIRPIRRGISAGEAVFRSNHTWPSATPSITRSAVSTESSEGVKKIKDAKTVGGTKVDVTYNILTGVHIGTAKEMAHVQNSDIHATNGVIHVIDKVILP